MSIFPPYRKLECSRCNKPLEDKHWVQRYCRKCTADYNRERRRLNPLSEYEKFKQRARMAATRYEKMGMIRKQPCVVCGSEKTEKHHEDYNKPLEITWLCRPCHKQLHLSRRKSVTKC